MPAHVEFLAARLRQARPNNTQNGFSLVQLLTGFGIDQRWEALSSVGWRHVNGKAVDGTQSLEAKSGDLIGSIAI